jgi:hypothetical protein
MSDKPTSAAAARARHTIRELLTHGEHAVGGRAAASGGAEQKRRRPPKSRRSARIRESSR